MTRLDREAWLDGAFRLLAAGSVDDVKIEPLAKSLGVTKGSFYWHFDDRPSLLKALLDRWSYMDTERIIELVEEPGPDDPVEALKRLTTLTLGTVSEFDGVEVAVRTWAATDAGAAEATKAVDERRLGYVTDLLVAAGVPAEEAGGRADLLYRVVIGEYVWRQYGGAPIDLDAAYELIDHLADGSARR